MKENLISVASYLVREVMQGEQSSFPLEKGQLTAVRSYISIICQHESMSVTTRYKKDTGLLHVFKV